MTPTSSTTIRSPTRSRPGAENTSSVALRGERYRNRRNDALADFIVRRLRTLDFGQTLAWYTHIVPTLDEAGRALLGCNDRYFLFTGLLKRRDGLHPWLFDRCREVEAAPDDHLDLWSRGHYKSSIIGFAGAIQEIVCDPEITIAIFSNVKPIAHAFLGQIMQELESNEHLKQVYADVFWANPRKEAPLWSIDRGIVVRRATNPKEATVEAHGLIDGQPISRHYMLRIYDDIVTDKSVTTPEMIRKTTEKWELSDNLGSRRSSRRWHAGTRYSFGDTYGLILERGVLKPRIYPATVDGGMNSEPVFLTAAHWESIKKTQRRTVAAQMLLNPVADSEAVFRSEWFSSYDVIPAPLNVYIMCDPSKGATARSDRTAIGVVGIDQTGNKYLLDGVRHRMRLSERWTWLKRLQQKWEAHPGVQVVRVGYERYGAQVDLEVIEEYQRRDNVYFPIEELAFPRRGEYTKRDRIERLEPDLKKGVFHLPAVVWHPEAGNANRLSLWRVWSKADRDKATRLGTENHAIGTVVYRPYVGRTKAQREAAEHRVVNAIKRQDENAEIYDLTRVFMEELRFFPFAPHDDLIDAVSRIYDLEPQRPVQYEAHATEPLGEDVLGITVEE